MTAACHDSQRNSKVTLENGRMQVVMSDRPGYDRTCPLAEVRPAHSSPDDGRVRTCVGINSIDNHYRWLMQAQHGTLLRRQYAQFPGRDDPQ